MYSRDTHAGLGTAQVTAIADINKPNSINSCNKNDIFLLLLIMFIIANSNYSQVVCQPILLALIRLSISMGNWLINIILGLLVTLCILVLIQIGVNFFTGVY